jgi:hypothetical protein
MLKAAPGLRPIAVFEELLGRVPYGRVSGGARFSAPGVGIGVGASAIVAVRCVGAAVSALILARSGLLPMIFMTRVRL